jgi:hypothetical protein
VWQNDHVQPRVDIRVADEGHVVATWGRTFIQIWRGPPTGKKSAKINQIAAQFVDESAFLATSLFIVEAKSPSPDDETRRNFATFSRDIVSKMSLSVIVSEGGGFRGALVRAVGVALTTILPHRSNFKFVNDVEAAAQLLGSRLMPGTGGAAELLRVADEVRAKIGEVVIADFKLGDSKLADPKFGASKLGDSKGGDSKLRR